jgi:spermidine synthase
MTTEAMQSRVLEPTETPSRVDGSSFPVPVISEEDGILTLHFQSEYVQSQMVLERPDFLALTYTRTMMAFELFKPHPHNIALIGLGGGSLAKWCYRCHPAAMLTVVEINPHVISLRDRFHIPEEDHRFQILCEDGAKFVASHSDELDVLLVDAFDVDSLPEDLCSEHFYDHCYRALARHGLLVVNLCAADDQRIFARILKSFSGQAVTSPDNDGNTVVFACKGELLWPEGASADFLKLKRIEFEKKHRLSQAISPVG